MLGAPDGTLLGTPLGFKLGASDSVGEPLGFWLPMLGLLLSEGSLDVEGIILGDPLGFKDSEGF